MRYPRAFLIFNSADDQLDESYFKDLANSKRNIYLENISKTIRTIEDEIVLIKGIDSALVGEENRRALVLSGTYEAGFINYYFSDKNLSVYWIKNKSEARNIWALYYSLQNIYLMRRYLEDACLQYSDAYAAFASISNYSPYPSDEFIDEIASYAYFEKGTTLEREVKSLINSKVNQKILSDIYIN